MGEKAVGSALSHDCPSLERELVQTRKIFPQSVLLESIKLYVGGFRVGMSKTSNTSSVNDCL